ncbi:hypothetical protein ACFQ9X_27580 [Catenulispora yoronensis]
MAIVDAGDDPTAEADLAVYRSTYGLPPCTTANGCFKKVNERGAATPLPQDMGWGVEIALDLDMVSAACPQCKILLVEGDQPTMDDLGASVNTAVALGATEVSNSYGGTEGGDVLSGAAYYTHPGVAIVASSGDYGYGVPSAPAVYPSVVSVGGTSLTKAAGTARGWTESAWIGAAAAARPGSTSRPGSTTPTARAGWSPTWPPTPTRRPARPSTAPPTASPAGASSAAPAPRPRSSRASSGWPATRRSSRTPRRSTPTTARCST